MLNKEQAEADQDLLSRNWEAQATAARRLENQRRERVAQRALRWGTFAGFAIGSAVGYWIYGHIAPSCLVGMFLGMIIGSAVGRRA